MNLAAVPRRSLEARIRNIRGETYLGTSRRAFQLSEVAASIWKRIDGRLTGDEIAERVAEEYEADVATVAADVSDFLDRLRSDELVEVTQVKEMDEA